MNEAVVAIEALTRHFGAKTALNNVSVTLPRGTVFGLVGANGTGKSSLLKMLVGQQAPDSGSVRFMTRVAPSPSSDGAVM